jgi:hypothetical protein
MKFLATIYKIWLMRHVDVPEDIADSLIEQLREASNESSKRELAVKPKHIPVVATVNHVSVRTTLVPAGGGHYRLQLNTQLRKAGRADTGEVIGVSLKLDTDSREVELPPELAHELKTHPLAKKEFERLPPGHRRQLLLYYLRAKSPEARAHTLQKFIDHLRERALLGPSSRKSRPTGKRRT